MAVTFQERMGATDLVVDRLLDLEEALGDLEKHDRNSRLAIMTARRTACT